MGLSERDIARLTAWIDLRNNLTPAIDSAMRCWEPGDDFNVAVYRDGHTIKVNIERIRDGRNVRGNEPNRRQVRSS